MEFLIPDNWAQCSVDGTTNYWLKTVSTIDPTIVAKVYHILPGDSVPTLLSLSGSQILNEEWAWCFFNKYLYTTIRNTGNVFYEGVSFLKSSSSEALKEQFFCVENPFKTDYINLAYSPGTAKVDGYRDIISHWTLAERNAFTVPKDQYKIGYNETTDVIEVLLPDGTWRTIG